MKQFLMRVALLVASAAPDAVVASAASLVRTDLI